MTTEIVESILGPPEDREMTYLPVRLIAIGSLTYTSKWAMDWEIPRAQGFSAYIKPRFYLMNYLRNVFGDHQPLATLIGFDTTRGVVRYVSNFRNFDPLIVC